MKYVVSDIHGRLDRLKKLLERINFSKEDVLYVLGDLVDRGPEPIEVIKFIKEKKNIISIMGNHDEMMLKSLRDNDEKEIIRWRRNGYETTLNGFNKLCEDEKKEILSYLDSLEYFKIIDDKYILVHAGFETNRLIADMLSMSLEEGLLNQKDRLVWVRGDFYKNKGLDEYTVIFGHNPRESIDKNFDVVSEIPYKIWFDVKYKDKICIDTGNCYEGGRMACLRLDDMMEFYIE
ncbi:metallophosphoesterase family protein [Clostridium sp. Marseille-Q7071]